MRARGSPLHHHIYCSDDRLLGNIFSIAVTYDEILLFSKNFSFSTLPFSCRILLIWFQHPFINRELDAKPIRDLLLEYKAEVVEEEVVDEDADVSILLF